MAYFAKRTGGRLDIREAVATARGPRSRTLATFRGALTPEILERAERRAARPFARERLLERAVALGVPVTERREERAARELLGLLRQGASVDPVLKTLLKNALDSSAAACVPAPLAEVSEWIGVGAARRGETLRDLLRLSDRIVRSRPALREKPRVPFPRFSSRRPRS